MTAKLVITVSLPDVQHQRDSVKNKPLGKAFNGIAHLGSGRHIPGDS